VVDNVPDLYEEVVMGLMIHMAIFIVQGTLVTVAAEDTNDALTRRLPTPMRNRPMAMSDK
jgi:hypothetical protein